jgi:molybdenum cofactor cytidylyltransferase
MGEQNKALLMLEGRSFLATIAGLCTEAGIEELVVVVAEPHEQETRRAAEALGLACVRNEQPERGMGSSVAVGFDYALRSFESAYAWLWPVDVPRVEPATLLAVSAQRRPDVVAIPTAAGRGGHPVLVARSIWSELAQCADEPEGARSVFRRRAKRILRVPVADPKVCRDVDHPDDLQKLSEERPS